MFTWYIANSVNLGALLRTLTTYKSSPFSFKLMSCNCRYSKELNELASSVRGMISAYGYFSYKQKIYEIICTTLRSSNNTVFIINIRFNHQSKFNITSHINISNK